MRKVVARAHYPAVDDPPRLLRNPPNPGGPLPPIQHGEELAALHRDWAAHVGGPAAGGPWARARRKAAKAVRAPQVNRGLIGDLIRAVDALARRVDDLGNRMTALEDLVAELVVVTGEDLARVQAALATSSEPTQPSPPDPDGDGS